MAKEKSKNKALQLPSFSVSFHLGQLLGLSFYRPGIL
jgi:hypothetical protein